MGALGGGWWDDQGVFNINYVGEAPPDEISSLVPPGTTLIWHRVRYGNADLLEVAQAARRYANDHGGLTTVAIDSMTDQVVIGVLAETERNIREDLGGYGDRVLFVVEEMPEPVSCTSRTSCTPWRGGIRAESYANDGDTNHSSFTLRGVASSGSCWIVTAGHAGSGIAGHGWDHDFWHDGDYVGYSSSNNNSLYISADPTTDSRKVAISCSTGVGGAQHNWLYKDSSNPDYQVSSVKNWTTMYNGEPVCKAGASASGYSCGTITNDNYYWTVTGLPGGSSRGVGPGIKISVSGGIWGGDSGAPVFYGSFLYGSLSLGTGATSAAQYIQTALTFHFCITYQCNY